MRAKKTKTKKNKRHAQSTHRPCAASLSVHTLREEPVPYGSDPASRHDSWSNGSEHFTTIDLFCGAGGITEGFRRAGYQCIYANDADTWAVKTFQANHPATVADNRKIEEVDGWDIREKLKIRRGELDVLVGGPPCQGFSINAPERFLDDPRNSLFRHYIRFIDEFEPQFVSIESPHRIQPLFRP